MIVFSVILLIVAICLLIMSRYHHPEIKISFKIFSLASVGLSAICFFASVFAIVSASTVGVVTTFGQVSNEMLLEGPHLISPFAKVYEVSVGLDVAKAEHAEAASSDLQSVHSDLTVNFTVRPTQVVELYRLDPSRSYKQNYVLPSVSEAFKSVVSRYTAEQLITRRAEVSHEITTAIGQKLNAYHMDVQGVNLVNFGFSKSFNEAIEQKVTASQQSETAKRNLEKVQYETQQVVVRAEGEAKAIAIQSAAVEKQGGAAYIQLRAIDKWDGKLPQYTGAASPLPFISVK